MIGPGEHQMDGHGGTRRKSGPARLTPTYLSF